MTQTFPTDALLHGAQPSCAFTVKGDHIEIGSIERREPIYAEGDDTRQNALRSLEPEDLFQIASIKEVGQELIDLISTLPLSRELALAKTKVEEAVMWAVKGVTK